MGLAMNRKQEEQEAVEALMAAEGVSEEEIMRDKLQAHIATTKISQTDVARAIGMSPSAVNMFLTGTYKNPLMVVKALKGYFFTKERQAGEVQLPELAETSVYNEVTGILNYVHSQRDIGVIYGPAGIGKSTALKAYKEITPQTILITANQTIAGTTGLLDEIATALGRAGGGSARRVRKVIVDLLKNSGRMLIVDEAQHLSYKALETLRSIYDECGIGIALAGNESIYGNMVGKGAAPFAQLFSRVGIKRELTGQIKLEDISALLGAELDSQSLAYLHRVALEPGGIRAVMKLYKLARISADEQGAEIDLDYLRNAAGFMMQRLA